MTAPWLRGRPLCLPARRRFCKREEAPPPIMLSPGDLTPGALHIMFFSERDSRLIGTFHSRRRQRSLGGLPASPKPTRRLRIPSVVPGPGGVTCCHREVSHARDVVQ